MGAPDYTLIYVLSQIPDEFFTADAAGRAKFAAQFVDSTLLKDGAAILAKLPDGVFDGSAASLLKFAAAMKDGAAGTPTLRALTALDTRYPRFHVGTYVGTGASMAVAVPFRPRILFVSGRSASAGIGFMLDLGEADNEQGIGGTNDAANVGRIEAGTIDITATGFTAVGGAYRENGTTYDFLAVR